MSDDDEIEPPYELLTSLTIWAHGSKTKLRIAMVLICVLAFFRAQTYTLKKWVGM